MTKFGKILIFGIIATLFISQPSAVFACSCVAGIPQEESFEMAKAVFSGRVLSIDENDGFSDKILGFFKPPFSSRREVKIQVLESWKGVNSDVVTVATGRGGGDCGVAFLKNEEYLIYAYDASERFKTELGTDICNRTQTLFAAWEEVLLLGEGTEYSAKRETSPDESDVSMNPSLFALIAYGALIIFGVYFVARRVMKLFRK